MEPPPPQRRKRKVPQIKNPGPEGNVGSWDFLPSFQVEVPIPGPVINISGPEIVRSWDLRDLPGGGRSHMRSHRRSHDQTYQVLRVLLQNHKS
jgi:hypothetical protein